MSTYEDDLKTNFNILRQHYKSVFTTPKDIIWRWNHLPKKKKILQENGKLPESNALAVSRPVYKGVVKCRPTNYWPVALTNHLTKIF